MKRLLAVMVVALLFGVPLLVVLGWQLSAVLLSAWLGVLTIAILVARGVDLVRENRTLEFDNRAMRQRLTVARALVDMAFIEITPNRRGDEQKEAWTNLSLRWLDGEDADPHAAEMRNRAWKLKAQRELDAIRS